VNLFHPEVPGRIVKTPRQPSLLDPTGARLPHPAGHGIYACRRQLMKLRHRAGGLHRT
jgi:hypothetical protein